MAEVIPGSYLLEAVTPGGATDPGPVAWGRRAAVFGSADVENADVPMTPTIALSGHVRTGAGIALPAGATVSIGLLDPLLVPPGDGPDPSVKTVIGRDGHFTFAGLLPRGNTSLSIAGVPPA